MPKGVYERKPLKPSLRIDPDGPLSLILKQWVIGCAGEGWSLDAMLRQVQQVAVDHAFFVAGGSRAQAARMLKMHRNAVTRILYQHNKTGRPGTWMRPEFGGNGNGNGNGNGGNGGNTTGNLGNTGAGAGSRNTGTRVQVRASAAKTDR